MSADLFAAFGNPTPSPQIPSGTESANPRKQSHPGPSYGNSTLIDFSSEPQSQPQSLPSFSQDQSENDSVTHEVLFDASNEEFSDTGEDDWGDFETAKPELITEEDDRQISTRNDGTPEAKLSIGNTSRGVASKPSSSNSFDLLSIEGLDATLQESSRPPLALDCSTQNTHPSDAPQASPEPSTAWPSFEEDEGEEEGWGDFTDGVAENNIADSTGAPQELTAPLQMGQPLPLSEPDASAKAATPSQTHKQNQRIVRPTNIPPPVIILRLFPTLLEQLRTKATNGTARAKKQNTSQPAAALAEEISYNLKVIVHVIVGRSLRWKRDSILSQSTKIGPAGRSGGMKLSSVNKSENIREEKEAVEVLDLWKQYSGLLNSAITAGGKPPIRPVPGNMQVKTAAAQEGALKSSHACPLCGLRREERIPGVDDIVDDILEEWWTEHWGHSDCRRFWESNSGNLDQR